MCLGAYRPRRPQAASDSNAASRQQTQKNNIASSDPRLMVMAVTRCSLFVARKSLPLYSNGLWSNLTAGRLTQAAPTHKTMAVYFYDL